MIAKAEIDGEHGARVIAGLEAFLSARAAELEAEVEKFRTVEGLRAYERRLGIENPTRHQCAAGRALDLGR